MNARLSEVSTMYPSVFRQPSKARVGRTVRLLRKISIARGNWLTVSIHCGVVWTNDQHVATDNSKGINRDNSKASNRDNNKDSRAASRDRDRRVSGDNKARKASLVSKVIRVVSSKGNSLVAHKA